jgi:hypothetical protein
MLCEYFYFMSAKYVSVEILLCGQMNPNLNEGYFLDDNYKMFIPHINA